MEQCFEVCGVVVNVCCDDAALARSIQSVFGGLPSANADLAPKLRYAISRDPRSDSITVSESRGAQLTAASLAELLFALDKDVTLELQRIRTDLFFVHAGVVARDGSAWAISAPSGTGKSTTVWALVRGGLQYLSDELAPIEFSESDVRVHSYARALNLKQEPTAPYDLPTSAIRLAHCIYVPMGSVPSGTPTALTLRGILFLRRDRARQMPQIEALTPAQAAVHLYANALNPLAHAHMGLDMAIRIAERIPCLEIELGSLAASVDAIQRCMQRGGVA